MSCGTAACRHPQYIDNRQVGYLASHDDVRAMIEEQLATLSKWFGESCSRSLPFDDS